MNKGLKRYLTVKELSEETPYSERAIRSKIEKGQWIRGVHYEKPPDNRILMNPWEIQKWIENEG